MIINYFLHKFYFWLLFTLIKSIISSNNITDNPNIALIPFKTFYSPVNQEGERPFGAKDYFNTIHHSYSYLEIETGKNNNQKLPLFFILDDYSILIDDNYFKGQNIINLICNYSNTLSDSYEIDNTKNIYVANKGKCDLGREYFKIYSDISLTQYHVIKFNFFHSRDKSKNISYSCGEVGLLYASEELYDSMSDINFINQIHKSLSNVDVSWTFQYNSNNDNEYEGIFIIGIESLEKKENKNNLIPLYTKLTGYGIFEWKFPIDKLYIGEELYEINDEEIKIDSDIEGFEISNLFSDKLNEIFFNKYYSKKICENETVVNSRIVIYCYIDQFKESDIKDFPEINFYKYKIGFNFSFTGNELFFKKEKKYFFRMIIKETNDKDFIFGKMFLKKYQVIFNSDAKTMSFYKNNNNNRIVKDNINMNNKSIISNTVVNIIVGIVFLIFGIFLGKKYCFIDKKRYANELEDDNYVYKSNNDDVKKTSKLIEMS